MIDIKKSFLEHYEHFYRFAYKLTKDSSLAKDLVQDTFLRVVKFGDSYNPSYSFKSWVFAIEKNLYYSNFNKTKRRKTYSHPVNELVSFADDSIHAQNEGLLNLYEVDVLNKFNAISHKVQKSFFLHYKGYSYEEIADKLNVPIGTVKSRINYVRKKIQKQFHQPLKLAS